jgi:Spy/CpxP family protein refolding chaperone
MSASFNTLHQERLMKRFSRLWTAVLVVPMLGGVAWAEKTAADKAVDKVDKAAAKAARAAKGSSLKGAYAQMPNELSLSEDQKAQLLTKAAARDAEIKAWNQTNETKIKELREKVKSAQDAGNKDAAKAAQDEMAQLKKEMTAIDTKHDAEIQAILTPEQQNHWAGYSAYNANVGAFKKLNLTEEQKNKIKERYVQAGAQIKAAGSPKERATLTTKIREQAEADILTDEQRTALASEREAAKKAREEAKAAKTKTL